jgi:hypothetical protein
MPALRGAAGLERRAADAAGGCGAVQFSIDAFKDVQDMARFGDGFEMPRAIMPWAERGVHLDNARRLVARMLRRRLQLLVLEMRIVGHLYIYGCCAVGEVSTANLYVRCWYLRRQHQTARRASTQCTTAKSCLEQLAPLRTSSRRKAYLHRLPEFKPEGAL